MKLFDCFMYFNEDLILDIRLNELNHKVDKFVIIESCYTHSGERKNYNFDINKFKKFSDKIEYIKVEENPPDLIEIFSADKEEEVKHKQILNALKIENYQRNCISRGLKSADDEDFILISDVDEIPNLKSVNIKENKNKIILFEQYFFHYKFNLYLKNFYFHGTKGCKKKEFISPQWLRNVKNKKYPFYRIDTFFSKKKYSNVLIVKNGGWHFTNIMSAEKIVYKLKSFLHHADTPIEHLNKKNFEIFIKDRIINYDHSADKKSDRFTSKELSFFDYNLLPDYIKNNNSKFQEWFYKN